MFFHDLIVVLVRYCGLLARVVVVVLVTGVFVVLVRCFGFCCRGATFICVLTIQTSKIYMIKNNK